MLSYFSEATGTLLFLKTITGTLFLIQDPKNCKLTLTIENYNEISWRHLLCGVNLCSTTMTSVRRLQLDGGMLLLLVHLRELDYHKDF